MLRVSVLKLGILALVLVASACSGADEPPADSSGEAPTGYTVLVDAPFPDEAGLAFTQYFPNSLSVHPGERVVFEYQGVTNPHTVTFGADPDRSYLPQPLLADGSDNPAAVEPCFSPDAPTSDMHTCPSTVASALSLPVFDGSGYWSGGLEFGTVAVQLDPAIPSGTYPFFCTIHLGMGGVMEVVAAAESIASQAEVTAEGLTEQQAAVDRGETDAPVPEPSAPVKDAFVIAGWDTPVLNINRFEPAALVIKPGDTVTWTTEASYVHKVTFAQLVDDEVIDSDFMSLFDVTAQTFSVRFPDPGIYEYVCSFHAASMTGTVTVR
jgi:plastocyanin